MLAEPHYVFTLSDDAAKPEPSKVEAPPVEKSAETSPPSYAAALLRLRGAHKITTGRGVRVAVINSLIDRAHPEIEGSIAENFDAVGDANAPPHPHGTGIASAIVGHRQIEGAAPAAQILAVRAFSETDGAARAVGLDILAGFDWAVRQKAQVINMSFAGPIDPLLGKMLAAAASRRIVMIAAAGNEGPRAAPLYPAADAHVVAVSAVDERTQIYVNDNRGPYIALAAPGVDVLVAAPRAAYDLTTGTSVACAEVSGIAALVLEKKPNLDGPALRRLLQDTAHAFDGVTGAAPGSPTPRPPSSAFADSAAKPTSRARISFSSGVRGRPQGFALVAQAGYWRGKIALGEDSAGGGLRHVHESLAKACGGIVSEAHATHALSSGGSVGDHLN